MVNPSVKQILLADDDDDDQLFFIEALEAFAPGIECVTANDGKQAIEKLVRMLDLPQFIFLDINMPFLDGFGCLTHLKKQEKLSGIPIIVVSTSVAPSTVLTAQTLGADGYLTKPTQHKRLEDNLQKSYQRISYANFSIKNFFST